MYKFVIYAKAFVTGALDIVMFILAASGIICIYAIFGGAALLCVCMVVWGLWTWLGLWSLLFWALFIALSVFIGLKSAEQRPGG